MNKFLTTLTLSLFAVNAMAQINMEDSTAQVIGYWNIGEKESYNISLQKIKLRDADTTSNELMTYEVDVTVIDSTADSYLLEWHYYNYKTNSTNEMIQKLTSLSENIKVIIETNEFGTIQGVQNWEEVRDYLKKSIGVIKGEVKDIPNIDKVIDQIENRFSTKAGIESAAIQDAQQFYTFHGGKYLLGEVLEAPLKALNAYDNNKPLDSKITFYLDELNPVDNNFILRSSQEIDSDQLTDATYGYIEQMAKTMKTEAPKKEDIGRLTNVTDIASRLHGTGWLIYSIQTKSVTTMDATNIEERIIEIK